MGSLLTHLHKDGLIIGSLDTSTSPLHLALPPTIHPHQGKVTVWGGGGRDGMKHL